MSDNDNSIRVLVDGQTWVLGIQPDPADLMRLEDREIASHSLDQVHRARLEPRGSVRVTFLVIDGRINSAGVDQVRLIPVVVIPAEAFLSLGQPSLSRQAIDQPEHAREPALPVADSRLEPHIPNVIHSVILSP